MFLAELLYQHRNSQRMAVVDYKSMTYQELNRQCVMCSNLFGEGISENIAIFIPNSIEYLIAYFGVLFSKHKIILLNVDLTEAEISNIVQNGHVNAIVSVSKYEEKLTALSRICNIIYIDKLSFPENTEVEEKDFSGMGEEEEVIIFPTSGTTGVSKLVKISTKNILTNINALIQIYKVKPEDNELIVLPLYSAFSNIVMLNCVNAQAKVVFYQGMFSVKKFMHIILQHEITYCSLVPSLVKLIAKSNITNELAFSSLKRITFGGEKMSIKDLQVAIDRLSPVVLFYGYGMTEAGPLIATKTYDDWGEKLDSVGKPICGVDVKIIDDVGRELAAEEIGNIVVRGSNITNGYLNAECLFIQRDWLETGDVGKVDKDGYLYIYGRKKNIIISGGKNVFPEEVEEVILRMNVVKEVRVYAEEDSFMGESVVAEIVETDSAVDVAFDTIRDFCKMYLADYKIPRKIYKVSQIVKTGTNKIKRNV